MSEMIKDPETYIPLSAAVFNILLALADGDKHGYGIMLEVEANTGGQVNMGPGTLYGSIKRMLKSGFIRFGVRIGRTRYCGGDDWHITQCP